MNILLDNTQNMIYNIKYQMICFNLRGDIMNKICVLGDSISKGVILDNEKQKYRTSENGFAKLFSAGRSYPVENFSVFGCTVTKGLQILSRRMTKIENSDIVVTEFGGNDCNFNWAAIAENPEGEFSPETAIDVFIEQYKNILNTLKQMGKKIFVLNLPPLDEEKYFKWISRGVNGDNILKWLGGSPKYIYRWHEMYNDAVCKIAEDEQVPLVDIRSGFLELRDYTKLLCSDGIHPNEAGHRFIYEELIKLY